MGILEAPVDAGGDGSEPGPGVDRLSGFGKSFEPSDLGSGTRLINRDSKRVGNNCCGLWVCGSIRKVCLGRSCERLAYTKTVGWE